MSALHICLHKFTHVLSYVVYDLRSPLFLKRCIDFMVLLVGCSSPTSRGTLSHITEYCITHLWLKLQQIDSLFQHSVPKIEVGDPIQEQFVNPEKIFRNNIHFLNPCS